MKHKNYFCIHGHFYQPPRENPWLEWVELEASALPFHDWNERITRECYAPNAWARIHTQRGRISKLLNNFAHISFDMGPTLLSWLHVHHKAVYRKILEADQDSRKAYSGHGTAMAQVYNHMIMPLADRRDKVTQVIWGIEDFRHRFKRSPEGMWLSETAVDLETLGIMAEHGISYTILSPHQASAVRPLGKDEPWMEVSEVGLDLTMPYRVNLPNGLFIDIFFYNSEISRAIAFGNALASGEQILKDVSLCLFRSQRPNGIVLIATDGESYGHHFKFGDLALAWIVEHHREYGLTMTSPGQYLEMFPPTHEVLLKENTSWSCAHGIMRWVDDCGCSLSRREGWDQKWRRPLREGLNWLRDEIWELYQEECIKHGEDPVDLRNSYIKQLLAEEDDRSSGGSRKVPWEDGLLRFLESQRMAMFMFTSCGWFFDDITGIEATQILKYALRAVELVAPYTNRDLLSGLFEYLSRAVPNNPSYKDGVEVFERLVRPSSYAWDSLAASRGVCSILGLEPPEFLASKTEIQKELQHGHGNEHLRLGEVSITREAEGKEVFTYLAATHKNHLHLWVAPGGLERGIEELILQGLSLRDSCRNMLAELRSFLGGLRPFPLTALPRDMIYHLAFYETDKRGYTSNSFMRLPLSFELILEQDEFRHLYSDKKNIPYAIKQIITKLIVTFLINKEVSTDYVKLKLVMKFLKKDCDCVDKDQITYYANFFLKDTLANFEKNVNKSNLRKLIHYLLLHNALGLGADLFELQSRWYDIYSSEDFMKRQSKDIRNLLKRLGTALGFDI